LTQFVSPDDMIYLLTAIGLSPGGSTGYDDEHDVLETGRDLKINT